MIFQLKLHPLPVVVCYCWGGTKLCCLGFGRSHWIQGLTRIVLYVTPPPPNPSIERENINTNTKNLYEIFIRCVLIKQLSAATVDFLGLVLDGWPYRSYSVFTRVQVGWSVLDYVKALVQIKKFRIFKAFLKYAYPSCWYDNIAKHKWNFLRVRSKCDNRELYETYVWGKGGKGGHLHIYTQRDGKANPFQKEKQRVRELNIFTHHCLAFVNSRL